MEKGAGPLLEARVDPGFLDGNTSDRTCGASCRHYCLEKTRLLRVGADGRYQPGGFSAAKQTWGGRAGVVNKAPRISDPVRHRKGRSPVVRWVDAATSSRHRLRHYFIGDQAALKRDVEMLPLRILRGPARHKEARQTSSGSRAGCWNAAC